MNRRILALAVLGAAIWLTLPQEVAAFGGRKKSCDSGCSPAAAPADCGMAGGACAPQYTVSWVDQKVTAYKTETETKAVKVMVTKWVDAKEDYKYLELVPVTTKQKVVTQVQQTRVEEFKYTAMVPTTVKQKVVSQVQQTKVEAYKFTVLEPVAVKQVVQVQQLVPVTKDVETTVWDTVANTTKQKRTVSEVVCVPTVVTQTVAPCAAPAPCATAAPACGSSKGGLFSRLCHKKKSCAPACPAPCPTPCATGCDTPCAAPAPQTVQVTVMQRQVVNREIEVDVVATRRSPARSFRRLP